MTKTSPESVQQAIDRSKVIVNLHQKIEACKRALLDLDYAPYKWSWIEFQGRKVENNVEIHDHFRQAKSVLEKNDDDLRKMFFFMLKQEVEQKLIALEIELTEYVITA